MISLSILKLCSCLLSTSTVLIALLRVVLSQADMALEPWSWCHSVCT